MVALEAPGTLRGAARELAIELSARAGEAEALRAMPRDVVDKLKRAGLFRMSLPQTLGGLELEELDPITTFEIVELLAAADGSAGWTVMIGTTHQSGTSIRGDRVARFGNHRLKNAFFLAAFSSLQHPPSRTYYDRKRSEGKRLGRRRGA